MARTRDRRKIERLAYYEGAANLWYQAVCMQRERCKSASADTFRIELNLYAVCVKRLLNVARMVSLSAKDANVQEALDTFQQSWPAFFDARNSEEHITGPTRGSSMGAWYFRDGLVQPRANGRVSYIYHIDNMQALINKVYHEINRVCAGKLRFLNSENGPEAIEEPGSHFGRRMEVDSD